jgi:hypothetical protein
MLSLLVGVLTAPALPGDAPAASSDTNHAPTPADMARAKAEEAERLFHERDLAGALSRLREAFALFPSPKIHYNFGLVERALLREVDAMASFERFLAEAPDADPARRADAVRQLAELAGAVVTVQLRCDTPGAEVFIDGRMVGTTPLAGDLRVSAGPHQVLVQKEGIPFPFVQRIEGPGGAVVPVHARLASILQSLRPKPVVAPETIVSTKTPEAPVARPLYRRGWFWAGAAALASTAGISAVLIARSRQPSSVCGQACALGEFSVDGQ